MRKFILTPPVKETPRINGPKVVGVRPSSDFSFTIPVTGRKPLTLEAQGLPKGFVLDQKTGRIVGSVAKRGTYTVQLKASNALGSYQHEFRIVVGDQIALTPPLGWSSWNCWQGLVTQDHILNAAKAMVEKGLINHGWSYINIDDGWQGIRGGKYNGILPNQKFPDMKMLVNDIHAMGLKAGIYSGPWVGTYYGHVGAYSDLADGTYDWVKEGIHDENFRYNKKNETGKNLHGINYHHGKYSFVKNDVQQWMDWGFDYLKYDWNPNDYYHVKEMYDALRAYQHDVVFSLSNSAPYADAPVFEKFANVWRTTGDIRDSWDRVVSLGFSQMKWAPFCGPGHWSDPDMLVVGVLSCGKPLHFTKLTANEQYSHMSLWSLLASPLLIGCDMSQMDDFTLNLFTNDEVIEVNQDPLGKMAMPILEKGDCVVYEKTLEDGSVAVGLFNKGLVNSEITVTWGNLGLRGKQTVRDLWRQQDLGNFEKEFKATVEPHGVVFVKIYPGNPKEQSFTGK
ncbi:MAG TPA: putative Ig domain-containing protein [Bacteroidales bacterium]|nr:putative Ig domain-containing protein [Bacteroidales bacterium]